MTFAGIPQSALTNGTYIAIGQPGASITYNSTTFSESAANSGAIDQTVPLTLTLTGDTFPAAVTNGTNLTPGVHYSLLGLPIGLTMNLRKDSATQLTAIITGNATNHDTLNNVNDFAITFTDAAFTSSALAAYVVDYNKSDIVFDFADPNGALIEFSTATAASTDESIANNFPKILVKGTLSSTQNVDVIVSGGTATAYGVDYTHGVQNILTVSIPAGIYDGLIGTAITITPPTLNNDIASEGGETIIFGFASLSAALTVGDANANATTQSTHTYTITDDERSLTYTSSTLTENSANVGTFTTGINFTLSSDTFTTIGALSGTYVTVANVPAGLTMVVTTTSATTGTITFTGSAAAHANVNDTNTVSLTFKNAVFTG